MPVPRSRPLPAVILDRPLIRLYEISLLIGIEEFPTVALRKICAGLDPPIVPVTYGIDVDDDIDDENDGDVDPDEYTDLLTPRDAHRLIKHVITRHNHSLKYRHPKQLDRVTLLLWMCGLHARVKRSPQPYARTVEYEIRRIKKLKEPFRTMRAVDLMSKYVDAKDIAKSFFELRMPAEVERVERKLDKLCGLAVEDDDEDGDGE
jgi:hypothetical protein